MGHYQARRTPGQDRKLLSNCAAELQHSGRGDEVAAFLSRQSQKIKNSWRRALLVSGAGHREWVEGVDENAIDLPFTLP
jgi:hypothetical protein